MRLSYLRASSLAAMLLSTISAESALAQDGTGARDGASSRGDTSPGEIIVTARRREESLQETPIAVTALSAEALEQSGVTRADDIARYVPNLVFERDAASSNLGRVLIRGVGALNAGITNDPGVGVYLDGIVLARAGGTLLDTLDLERVEVLRGPQGTLYGRNTVGGAVNFITAKPGPDFSGSFSASLATPLEASARASINAPLVDGLLYSRFAGFVSESEGYTKNFFDGQNYDESDRYGFRGALRLTPSANLTIDATADYSKDDSRGPGAQCTAVDLAAPPPLVGLIFFTSGEDYLAACRATEYEDKTRFAYNAPARSFIEQYGASLTAALDTGTVGPFESGTLKAILGWRRQNPRRTADLDGTPLTIIHASDFGKNSYTQRSAEIQYSGNAFDDRLQLTTGFYAFDEVGTSTRFTIVAPSAALIGLFLNATDRQEIDNSAWAGYGQATLDLNDVISLTGGIRYTSERKGFDKLRQVIGANVPTGPVLSTPTNASLSEDFSKWTGMANVTLHLPESMTSAGVLDDGILYFTFSQGFKSGGFNGEGNSDLNNLNTFGEETLDSYEIGFKLTMFDRKFFLNTALFRSNYDDIQVSVLAADPLTGNIIQQILNAGSAVIQGVEVEAMAYPVPGLELRGAFGYTDADYRKFDSSFNGAPIDRSDEPFTRVPKYTASASAQSRVPVGEGAIVPRVEWSLSGPRFFHSSPIPAAITRFREPAYSLWNARVGFVLPGERAEVAVFARNIFNETYRRDGIEFADALGVGLSYYGPPRSGGIQLSYKF